MARGKIAKKDNLSIEERLEQALVPDWEQPYKVPSNWVWTRLNFISTLYTGNSINATEKNDKYLGATSGLNYIATKDIGFDTIIDYDNGVKITDFEKFKIASKGTALLCIEGGSAGRKIGFTEQDVCFGNKLCAFATQYVSPKTIYYYLQSDFFSKLFFGEYHGLIGGVSVRLLQNLEIPLPPLAEQQRIVDRLESLFAKLDEAKEKAQAALDGFENRKAAILHQAFTGELTQKWREENGVGLDSWGDKEFSEVAKIMSNLVPPSDYLNFPHIAPDNIEKRTGVLLNYKTIAEDGVTSGKHRFYSGQILYSKIRPYLSKVVIVDFDGLCSADMYPIEANENVKYLWYFMLSETFLEQASNAGSRSVLPKINQKEMSTISVSMCGVDEQTEIVRILDSIFEKEQQAKELASVIEKIDLMKKAILARAFRGELGTNDPNEESAMELLKTILEV